MPEGITSRAARLRFRMTPAARARLWSRMSTLAQAGIGISDVVEFLRTSRTTGRSTRQFVEHLNTAIRQHSFARAARGWVPAEELMIIEVTQESRIGDGLAQASRIAENRQKLRSTLFSGLIYPMVLLLVGTTALALLPKLALNVMTEVLDPAEWPPVSASVLAVSEFIAAYGLVILVTAVSVFIASVIAAPRWSGRLRDRMLAWYPPFALYRQFTAPEVLNAWTALMSAGITRDAALARLEKSLPPYLASHIRKMRAGLYRGDPVDKALDTGLFTLQTIDDLRVYQKVGRFDDNVERIAAEDISRALTRLQASTRTLAILMLLFIGAIAVWVYLGIARVAVSLQQTIF